MIKFTKKASVYWLRILLTLLSVGVLGFIFSNSLRTGEESSAQSGKVMELVQSVALLVAPNSQVATATGEAYERLHALVRVAAHFSEFALLGAVMVWCFYSYTGKKRHFFIPIIGAAIAAVADECLQLFTYGRGAEIADVLVDIGGGLAGVIFALCILTVVEICIRKRIGDRYGTGKP